MDNELQTLNKIPAYGRCLYNGQHFSIKYAMTATDKLVEALEKLKVKHPELVIYKAKTTKRVIFGGTFHSNSTFPMDRQTALAGLK